MTNLRVIDTNVWIFGFFWTSFPAQIVSQVYANQITPVFTLATWLELTSRTQTLAAKLQSLNEGNLLLKKIHQKANFTNPTQSINLCRDPHDNMLLEAAQSSHTPYLITGDKDLLTLKRIEQTVILTPKQYISIKII